MTNRFFRPLIPLFGTACLLSPFYFQLERFPSQSIPINDAPPRRLDIAVDSSDELVTAKLSVISSSSSRSIKASDHDKITSILDDARDLMTKARGLIENDSGAAKTVLDAATEKFREAKNHIMQQRKIISTTDTDAEAESVERETLEEEVTEDLDLDLSREVYETVSPYVV
jgi:hypothetical protein